jgi:hypothetical protein
VVPWLQLCPRSPYVKKVDKTGNLYPSLPTGGTQLAIARDSRKLTCALLRTSFKGPHPAFFGNRGTDIGSSAGLNPGTACTRRVGREFLACPYPGTLLQMQWEVRSKSWAATATQELPASLGKEAAAAEGRLTDRDLSLLETRGFQRKTPRWKPSGE